MLKQMEDEQKQAKPGHKKKTSATETSILSSSPLPGGPRQLVCGRHHIQVAVEGEDAEGKGLWTGLGKLLLTINLGKLV